MTTTTALPREETGPKTRLCERLGRIVKVVDFVWGRGIDEKRVRVNLGSDGKPMPIKQHTANSRASDINNLIPGIKILTKGSKESIKHYVIINKETFYVDPCCHLKEMDKANKNWEESIAKAKGVDYNEKCRAILSYCKKHYLEVDKGKMPALGRICFVNEIKRDEIFKMFPGSPKRVIAMLIGAPENFQTEPLKKAPEIPFW